MHQRSIRYLAFAFIIAFSFSAGRAGELMVNGSFETGNFTGWTTTNATNPFLNWSVSGSGAGGTFVPVPVATQPMDGTKVAWQGIASNAGSSFSMFQQVAIPAGTAQLRWRDRFQDNLITFCGHSGEPLCGTVTYRVDITNVSNVVLQSLYNVTAPANAATDTGWHIHFANISAFAGQTIRVRFMTTPTVTWDGPGQLEVDAVSLQSPALPTAALVSVSGRATSFDGQGIKGSTVTITDPAGITRTALTNSFGYYQFVDIEVGSTYIVSIGNKRYLFPDSPRVISVTDQLSGLDFVASP